MIDRLALLFAYAASRRTTRLLFRLGLLHPSGPELRVEFALHAMLYG